MSAPDHGAGDGGAAGSGAGLALSARAPGKVNLCLFLGPVRSDGRHQLVSVVQSVSLADRLMLRAAAAGVDRDQVRCAGVEGPNLAAAALRRFRDATGWREAPVCLRIEKHVPVAAGMGGGSGDAAATLRLAARAHGDVAPELLAPIAQALGADVPSQLQPGRVLVSGAGEHLLRLADDRHLGVLVLPSREALPTASVFAEADRLGLGRPPAELRRLHEQLAGGVSAGLPGDLIVNDLEPACVSLVPETAIRLERARAAGADVAVVSGSGPTVVGLFLGHDGPERARAAERAVAGSDPPAHVAEPVDAAFGDPIVESVRHN